MLNWFKKKKTLDILFSISEIPKKYRKNKIWIKSWEKFDGEYIKKGEKLCELEIENVYWLEPIDVNANKDGILEIFKQSPTESNENLIVDKEKLFAIHNSVDNKKAQELKNKKFENIPKIEIDEFSGTKQLKWESISGRKKNYSYDTDLYDCIITKSFDDNFDKLMFALNNIDGKDYIIFKYPTKNYKLKIRDSISFLFENGQIIQYEIENLPYKSFDDTSWGIIYETKVQMTFSEINIFKNQNFSKWQIEFASTGKKITGGRGIANYINLPDLQFAIKKLANDYLKIVQKEISNYIPLNDRNEILTEQQNQNDIESTCYIYLMVDLSNNYYKIGISNKPAYRERTLQSEKPTVEMLCYKEFPNRKIANNIEQALHKTYSKKRIRGEWFDLTEKEVTEIKKMLK